MATPVRVRLVPLLWFLFGLFVNTLVLCTSSRLPHGVTVRLPSLTPPAQLDGLKPFASGSFLSTAARPRSASLTFASPEDSGAPYGLLPTVRHRSQSLGSGRQAPSGVWSRNGEAPNLEQPQQQQQAQEEQAQQQKRRRGRLHRLRKALKRLGGTAKEKLRRLWQSIKRGASRAKRAARQAAIHVYKKLPRLRKTRKAPEGAEVIATSGLAGAGLASAAPHLGPGEEIPEEVKTLEEEEVSTPVSPGASTTSTATEETAAPSTPEEPYRSEEAEEWFEARTPEQAEEESEEWHDAVSPEEMERVLVRARESEQMRREEKVQVSEETEELGLTPQCLKYYSRMTIVMKKLCKTWRGHCMFWSLFMKTGNFGTFVDDMQDMAVKTGALILSAELLRGTEDSIKAHLLRMHLVLALAEESIANAVDRTEEYCWFTNPDNLFTKANPEEEKVMLSLTPLNFFAEPLKYLGSLKGLIDTAYGDSTMCVDSVEAEIKARMDLRQILASEKQRLEIAIQELPESAATEDSSLVMKVIRELELLAKREYCSIEQAYLLATQSKNIQAFIDDYRANGASWWRAQWPFKLQSCRPLTKGNAAVPKDVAQNCRNYESSSVPKSQHDVSETLLWMWDAGSCRKG
ncbi:hypothetical protein, conserved [Eimeria maxima]|uniref:Uncharacterized protein n=1 Tax=Eimeria maxima TaxID=5804 RepID=U6MGX8_EIMMA|nr:hypothetical protein, conserved [Eimeria maxima]CDJ61704.1 hypothetical protein, conserved [Eimeria maxima]